MGSTADPCLHYKWTEDGKLIVWLSWVDNCVVGGSGDHANPEKRKMMRLFDCNDSGEVREYIGTKVEVEKVRMPRKHSMIQEHQAWKN